MLSAGPIERRLDRPVTRDERRLLRHRCWTTAPTSRATVITLFDVNESISEQGGNRDSRGTAPTPLRRAERPRCISQANVASLRRVTNGTHLCSSSPTTCSAERRRSVRTAVVSGRCSCRRYSAQPAFPLMARPHLVLHGRRSGATRRTMSAFGTAGTLIREALDGREGIQGIRNRQG